MIECYAIIVYADTIPNFPEEMIEKSNLCDLIVPKEIANKWYEKNKELFHEDIMCEMNVDEVFIDSLDDVLDYWNENVSTADMADDLYEFCLSEKIIPGIDWYGNN